MANETMTLIATTSVGSGGTTAMVIDAIPQTYTDLFLVYSLRGNTSATTQEFPLYFNGNGASYSFRRLIGSGTYVNSDSASGAIGMQATGATATANTFSNGSVYIPNYTGSTYKTYSVDAVTETNATTANQTIISGLWSNTSAITNVSIQGSTIQQYSQMWLYGILKGSGGATVS
jgi:hypothetical protein